MIHNEQPFNEFDEKGVTYWQPPIGLRPLHSLRHYQRPSCELRVAWTRDALGVLWRPGEILLCRLGVVRIPLPFYGWVKVYAWVQRSCNGQKRRLKQYILYKVFPPNDVFRDVFYSVLEVEPVLVAKYWPVWTVFKSDFVNRVSKCFLLGIWRNMIELISGYTVSGINKEEAVTLTAAAQHSVSCQWKLLQTVDTG